MPKEYNTPKRDIVVKTRMTDEGVCRLHRASKILRD